jgi:hypothetical protein
MQLGKLSSDRHYAGEGASDILTTRIPALTFVLIFMLLLSLYFYSFQFYSFQFLWERNDGRCARRTCSPRRRCPSLSQQSDNEWSNQLQILPSQLILLIGVDLAICERRAGSAVHQIALPARLKDATQQGLALDTTATKLNPAFMFVLIFILVLSICFYSFQFLWVRWAVGKRAKRALRAEIAHLY